MNYHQQYSGKFFCHFFFEDPNLYLINQKQKAKKQTQKNKQVFVDHFSNHQVYVVVKKRPKFCCVSHHESIVIQNREQQKNVQHSSQIYRLFLVNKNRVSFLNRKLAFQRRLINCTHVSDLNHFLQVIIVQVYISTQLKQDVFDMPYCSIKNDFIGKFIVLTNRPN